MSLEVNLKSPHYCQMSFYVFQKHILFHEVQDHRVSTDLIALYATRQNQTSTVISGGSVTFYMPASLIQFLFVHHRAGQPCVIAMVTELTHSPYTWASYTEKVRQRQFCSKAPKTQQHHVANYFAKSKMSHYLSKSLKINYMKLN